MLRTTLIAVAALVASAAPARAADLPAELAELEKEGAHWFNVAGDTDLSMSERNEARKKAWVNLYRAKEILDRHWDEHPGDQGRIEDRLMSVGQKVFWIRKESPIGLLESTGVGPKADAFSGGTNSDGRKKQADWPDREDPAKEGNAPGDAPRTPPPTSPPPSTGPAAPPAAPTPAGPDPEKLFAEAEAYAKKHRADTAGILDRYQAVMLARPDPNNTLFQKAAERAGAAQAALKDVYRRLRNEDPDSLKDVDGPDLRRMVLILSQDLGNRDSAVRARAAKLLGDLGSSEGTYPLVKALRTESDGNATAAIGRALVAIAGGKTTEQLKGLRDDKAGSTALDLLLQIRDRNPVDRRLALVAIGPFALSKDAAVADRAVDALIATGKEGAYGLVEALGTKSVDTRVKIIDALGQTGHPRVAAPLSGFLLLSDDPNVKRLREAAHAAIKSLGEPAVPYLFQGLRSPSTKAHTALLLREMTGQLFSMSRPGDWQAWWKRTHPDWKPEKD